MAVAAMCARLFDEGQDFGPSCQAHPGGQERAWGLRSHGDWAVASLAHARFLFLVRGLRHQIRCCLPLAPSAMAGLAPAAQPASPTGLALAPHCGRAPYPQGLGPPSSQGLAPSLCPPVRPSVWFTLG